MSSKTSSKWNSLGDFLRAKEERDKEEQQQAPQVESQQIVPSPTTPNHPQPPPVTATPSPAPLRDFNRRANSIEREALPQGLFPGSSKKLWDAVYFRTRGAIQPIMEIRATKRDLMMWSGIRNIKTIETHLRYFLATGMMTRRGENGDSTGYSYGVVMLEETPLPSPTIPYQHGEPPPLPNQKTVMGGEQKMVMVGEGNPIDNKDTYGLAKTSFKTNTERTDDDEAAPVLRALKMMIEEVTGREAARGEYTKLVELIEVLTLEGKIASGRTTISSVGPFLAEHLRRRLFKKNKQEMAVEASSVPNEHTASSIDIRQCPDCHGTSMYYPDGYEKGVAKCRHKPLLEQQTESPSSKDSDSPDKASDVPSIS